jgi:hypothetical protein
MAANLSGTGRGVSPVANPLSSALKVTWRQHAKNEMKMRAQRAFGMVGNRPQRQTDLEFFRVLQIRKVHKVDT